MGGELVSFKLDGEERVHQGLDCVDENGKVYWKRHWPVLFPVVGKLKKNQTIINGRIFEMPQHGFARDFEFEPITKLDNFHSYVLKSNKIQPFIFISVYCCFSMLTLYWNQIQANTKD